VLRHVVEKHKPVSDGASPSNPNQFGNWIKGRKPNEHGESLFGHGKQNLYGVYGWLSFLL